MADLPFFGNSSFGGGGGIISGNPVVDAELAENGDMILKMSDRKCRRRRWCCIRPTYFGAKNPKLYN